MSAKRYPALLWDRASAAGWQAPRPGLHTRLARLANWANAEVERSSNARGIALFLLVCIAIVAVSVPSLLYSEYSPLPALASLGLLVWFHINLVKLNRRAAPFFARHYQHAWRWLSHTGNAVVALDDLYLTRVLRPVADWWATKGLQLDLPRPLEQRIQLVAAFRGAIFEVAAGRDASAFSLYLGVMEYRNYDVWAFTPCFLCGIVAALLSPLLLALVALALVPYYIYRYHTQRLERNALLLALCDFVQDKPRREWLEA